MILIFLNIGSFRNGEALFAHRVHLTESIFQTCSKKNIKV